MDATALLSLLVSCAPLVHPDTGAAIVAVESSGNPHAIGVVGGQLDRQPRHLAEALATAQALKTDGRRYSLGLAQINNANFARLGLDHATAFDPCRNLAAMQSVLLDCLQSEGQTGAPGGSSQTALRRALSCYYSGNPTTGFTHGYVQRVVRRATTSNHKPITTHQADPKPTAPTTPRGDPR